MSDRKTQYTIESGQIELVGYDFDATLLDLVEDLDALRRNPGLRTATCHLCGECCGDLVPLFGLDLAPLASRFRTDLETLCRERLILPEPPDPSQRRVAIATIAKDTGVDAHRAALLYEYNSCEPVTFQRHPSGVCRLQDCLLCSIYGNHPLACKLYLCNMGEELSILYENIVRQGVWHSYAVLGWIEEKEILHNPFVGARGYGEVLLSAFDIDLSDALESLFFYF